MLRIQFVVRLIRRQERVHFFLIRDLHHVVCMRQCEAVQVHHHRRHDLRILRDLVCLQDHIERFLSALREQHDPARVPLGHRVALVAVNVPRRRCRAVRVYHHDRDSRAARIVQHLRHVQEPLRGRCSEGARTHQRCAERRRHRAVLALHHDVIDVALAVGDEIRDLFYQCRLRCDRIRADDLRFCQSDAVSRRLVGRQKCFSTHRRHRPLPY